jgi:hypothetical protein
MAPGSSDRLASRSPPVRESALPGACTLTHPSEHTDDDMADEADIASERAEIRLEAARRFRYPSLPDVGACHSCGEMLDDGRRFCDADCRDDWEAARKMRALSGS